MNKAFVREAEDETSPKCPRCHAIGRPVGPGTLTAQVGEAAAMGLAVASTHYCPNPTCDLAYFDAHGQTAPVARMGRVLWPKRDDPEALLCPCMSLTAGDLIADAQRNDPTRIRALLATAQAHPERCAGLTPDARPCTGEAQRLYLKHRGRA